MYTTDYENEPSYIEGMRAGYLDFLLGLRLQTALNSSNGLYAQGYKEGQRKAQWSKRNG